MSKMSPEVKATRAMFRAFYALPVDVRLPLLRWFVERHQADERERKRAVEAATVADAVARGVR